jgi:hypothetical protein
MCLNDEHPVHKEGKDARREAVTELRYQRGDTKPEGALTGSAFGLRRGAEVRVEFRQARALG